MKLQYTVQVENLWGLHARPATRIARLLENTQCSVFFSYNAKIANAKRVWSLLLLEVKQFGLVDITVEGEDAKNVLELLIEEFKSGFGEKGI